MSSLPPKPTTVATNARGAIFDIMKMVAGLNMFNNAISAMRGQFRSSGGLYNTIYNNVSATQALITGWRATSAYTQKLKAQAQGLNPLGYFHSQRAAGNLAYMSRLGGRQQLYEKVPWNQREIGRAHV